jgi:hypothetical protein
VGSCQQENKTKMPEYMVSFLMHMFVLGKGNDICFILYVNQSLILCTVHSSIKSSPPMKQTPLPPPSQPIVTPLMSPPMLKRQTQMQHPSHCTGAADVGTLVICATPFFVCPAAFMLRHLIVTNIVLLPLHATCKLKKDGEWSIERLVLHHIRILILKIATHLTCFLDKVLREALTITW